MEPLGPLKLPSLDLCHLVLSQPSNQVNPLDQLNMSIPDAIPHPLPHFLNQVSGIVDGMVLLSALSYNQVEQVSFEPMSSNGGNITKSNFANLLANNSALECEPLETNDSIELTNRFDTLLLEALGGCGESTRRLYQFGQRGFFQVGCKLCKKLKPKVDLGELKISSML